MARFILGALTFFPAASTGEDSPSGVHVRCGPAVKSVR